MALVLAHWSYLSTRSKTPPDWGAAATIIRETCLTIVVVTLLLRDIEKKRHLLHSQGWEVQITRCKIWVVENRCDWEEVATWLPSTGILQISATTLRKYYFDVTGEVDPGATGRRRRTKPELSVSQQKPEQPRQTVNLETTKSSPNSVDPVSNVPPAVQEPEPPVASAEPPPESAAMDSPEPAKTDDKPEPKKKLTALQRLRLMEDEVYVPDEDDEEAAAEPELVIRGNFSIMPPDDEL